MLNYWSTDMLKFDFLQKDLGIVSPSYFVYDFFYKNVSHVIYYERYTNADLKICQHLRLHMKMRWKFQIKTLFTFWNMRTKVKSLFINIQNNRIC